MKKEDMITHARQVLSDNDRGTYTVPTHGFYPFQWNWDSALSGLGFAQFNEERAWTEIDTLMAHQWEDGMVPHIIFHQQDDGYFSGPEVWGTGRTVPTTGITQPPVAGFAVRRINGFTAPAIHKAPVWWPCCILGSPVATTQQIGMTQSVASPPRVLVNSPAAIPPTPTRRAGPRTSSTSAISGL